MALRLQVEHGDLVRGGEGFPIEPEVHRVLPSGVLGPDVAVGAHVVLGPGHKPPLLLLSLVRRGIAAFEDEEQGVLEAVLLNLPGIRIGLGAALSVRNVVRLLHRFDQPLGVRERPAAKVHFLERRAHDGERDAPLAEYLLAGVGDAHPDLLASSADHFRSADLLAGLERRFGDTDRGDVPALRMHGRGIRGRRFLRVSIRALQHADAELVRELAAHLGAEHEDPDKDLVGAVARSPFQIEKRFSLRAVDSLTDLQRGQSVLPVLLDGRLGRRRGHEHGRRSHGRVDLDRARLGGSRRGLGGGCLLCVVGWYVADFDPCALERVHECLRHVIPSFPGFSPTFL